MEPLLYVSIVKEAALYHKQVLVTKGCTDTIPLKGIHEGLYQAQHFHN